MKELWKILAYTLIGVLLCLNVYQCHRGRTTLPHGVYTDTLTVYDTIPVIKPIPRDSVVIRYITEKLPKSVPTLPNSDEKLQESVPNTPEIVPDSVEVEIPITQKTYETENYKAYVSGYRPNLDSLFLYPQRQIVQIKSKPKRWGIGIQVGYGVTVGTQPQFAPYIGVGVSYNLWNF